MTSPKISNTLKRLARRLFAEESGQDRFIRSIVSPPEYPVAVIWTGDRPPEAVFETLPSPDWMPSYIDLVTFEQRPGRHALHDAGAYYCLDPSSVFMTRGFSEVTAADTVLDVCASPGGKSVLAWRALRPGHLWSNEVIGKRTGALISNLKRCRIAPASVISVDSARLASEAAHTADVVLVDAPCSGQSLVARGKESPGCFHPATINMNANRQRRILANSAATVRPGGWLIYMTCTYSLKENERNVEWFLKKQPQFEAQTVASAVQYQSDYSESPCYRLWPADNSDTLDNTGRTGGAGGFFALFRNVEAADRNHRGGSLDEFSPRWTSGDCKE